LTVQCFCCRALHAIIIGWLLVYTHEHPGHVQPLSRAAVNIATTAAAAASLQPHQKRTHSSAKAFVAQEKRL
jgi:hypothetical protein